MTSYVNRRLGLGIAPSSYQLNVIGNILFSGAGAAALVAKVTISGTVVGVGSTYGINLSTSFDASTTTNYGIYSKPTFTGTSAITNAYNLYVDNSTKAAGTITTATGIYLAQPSSATTNVGFNLAGTTTGANDINLQISTTFTPTATATLYASKIAPSLTYASGASTTSTFYTSAVVPMINITSASVSSYTNYYTIYASPSSVAMSGAAHNIGIYYGIYSASPAPTLANGSTITTAYSGYFAAPGFGTTKVALYANDMTLGTATAFAPLATDTNRNVVSLTTGISNSGYILTSTGAGSLPTWQANTGGVTSITGTANQITASAPTGAITLSLPSAVITPGSLQTTNTFAIGGAVNTSYYLYVTGTPGVASSTMYAQYINNTITAAAAASVTTLAAIKTNVNLTTAAGNLSSSFSFLSLGGTFTGTAATINTAYGILLSTPTFAGTTSSAFGIYNNVPIGASTNYGYYQAGGFTGNNDSGMYLANTFNPFVAGGSLSQFYSAPTYMTSNNSIGSAYAANISPSFIISGANAITSAFGIDVTIADTINAAATLGSSYGIRVGTTVSGINATPITNAYNIHLNGMTVSGSAVVTTGYGIYNSVPVGAITNYGYYSAGTFTKENDKGMQLNNTFTPTIDNGALYQFHASPTFYTTTNTIGAAYAASISPTFNVAGANNFSNAVGLDINVTGSINAAAILNFCYGAQIGISINGSNATPVSQAINLYLSGVTVSGSATLGLGYGIYNSIPTGATTNYGYFQGGTFVKNGDIGMQLNNSFTPTANGAALYQFYCNPDFNTTTNTIVVAYAAKIEPTFNISGIKNLSQAYGLDIAVTGSINAAATLGSCYGIRVGIVANGSNSQIINNAYNLYLNGITVSGSATISQAFGIYNSIPVGAVTNYGYYQIGTFTKANDVGMRLTNTFTPTTGSGTVYQLYLTSTFSTASNTITNAYTSSIEPIFLCNSANSLTAAYSDAIQPTFTVSSSGTITTAYCSYIRPTINVTTATVGTAIGNIYGVYVTPAAPTITTASVIVTNYYGVYSGTMPALTGSGNFTNAYGGYFLAPVTTATGTSSMALYATNASFGSANTTTSPPTNGILVQGNILNQTLAINSLVGTDGSRNLTTTTSGISASFAGLTLASPLTVPNGGTGLSTCALGDIFYGSGVNSLTNLSGNITTTKKFFNQTGNGAVSAAPQWSALVTSDLGTTMTPQFTAIGLGTAYSTSAFIVTSARTAAAVSNTYHIWVTGITTGSSSSTLLAAVDISTTNTASGGTLTNSTQLQITPNTNATTNTITNNYAMLINTATNTGGTVTNNYGIYNNTSGFGATLNVGHLQTGTFTKASDVGMKLNNTFTPAATATNYSLLNSPNMTISSGTVAMTNFYAEQTSPTINVTSATGAITFTGFYGISVNPTSVTLSGAAHILTTYYGIYSASPAPTLANGATITTAYSGYFAAPGIGTTKVALWAADITLNAATAFAPLAVDTNKNMVSLTTGMSNVGYVLTSTGNSSLPTWQAASGGGGAVSSVTGTANQVTCSPTTGAVVVSLPSAIITPGSLQTTNTFAIGGAVNTSYYMYLTGTPGVASTTMYAAYIDTTITAASVASLVTISAIKTAVNLTTAAGNTGAYFSLLDLSGTFTGTAATINSAYGLLLNNPTFVGTTTTAYGIRNNVPTGATNNYGYFQSGIFTKNLDAGMYLGNTFTPTSNGGALYQTYISPTYNTTTNTISAAAAIRVTPTFTIAGAFAMTNAFGLDIAVTDTINAAATLGASYGIRVGTTVTGSSATAISNAYNLYLNGMIISGGTAVITTGYGINNAVPTGANTNYGYYQDGTFSKASDRGMQLTNIFTPTANGANLYQIYNNPSFNTTTNTINAAAAEYIGPTFTLDGTNNLTSAYGINVLISNNINAAATLGASYGIQIRTVVNGSNATAMGVAYNLHLNGMFVGGSAAISNAYGIYNSAPVGAAQNYGYYQTGTFTKISDVGLWLNNTFTPTSDGGTIYQSNISPAFNTTTNTIASAYSLKIQPTFTIAGAFAMTNAYGLDVTVTNTINAAATLSSSYGIRVGTVANGSTATAITSAFNLYLNGMTTSGSAVISNGYGIYNIVPTGAAQNYGFHQTGTFTKANDIGFQLFNTFTPTSNAGTMYQTNISPTFNTTTNTINQAYAVNITPTFNIAGAFAMNQAYGLTVDVSTATNAAASLNTIYGIYARIAASGTNANAITSAYNLYLNGMTVSGSAVITTGYGIYNSVPTGASNNYGYFQNGTFTKSSDKGLYLDNTFTPTADGGSLYQSYMSPKFNTTTNTIGAAFAVSLAPTFTIAGAFAMPNAYGLDIIITDTINAAATLGASYGIRVGTVANGSNAAAITSAYNLYLNGMTVSGSAVITTGYGIYNSVPTGASNNYGYFQNGIFTKNLDIGMYLGNAFTPTTNGAAVYQLYTNPNFNTTTNTINVAAAAYIAPTFTISGAFALSAAYGLDIRIVDTINAVATLGASYGIRIGTIASGISATAITSAFNLYLNGMTVSGSAVITTGYGIYNIVPTDANTNYGYYQTGTFTKATDTGMYLNNSFTPTADSASLKQLTITPNFTTTTNTISSAWAQYIAPTFTINGAVKPISNAYGLEVAITNTISDAGTLAASYGIKIGTTVGGINATPITSAFNLYLNGMTVSGSAVISNGFGIYNLVPTGANANYGYWQTGTFTKANDIGMNISNTFTPTSNGGSLYQSNISPIFNTTTNTISVAYSCNNTPTFNCNSASSLTTAYSDAIQPTFTVSSSGTITSAYCNYISPTINVTTATVGTAISGVYGVYVTAAAPTITTASVVVTNYYGVYCGTMGAKTGSGNFANAYSAYFAAPVTTATSTSSMALYATNASFGTGNVTTSPPTNGLLVQGNILNQALGTNSLVGTDGSKNLTTATSGISPTLAGLTLTAALTVPNGGTGLNSSTLGSMFYGSGSNTVANLTGNITTTRKFFTQTGDGVNSAAPAWNVLVSGDLGTTLTPQFTAIGLGTAASTNAYLVTTNRTAAAVASTYHIQLTGTTTGSSSSTLLSSLDISTTNLASGATLTTSAQIRLTPNTDATTNNITNSYGMLINAGANVAGTVTNSYGAYITTPGFGTNKVALYSDSLQVGGTVSGAITAGTIRVGVIGAGVICASAALATNATAGFLYVPTCAGIATGAAAAQTGTTAIVYDTTNYNLMVYNGAWTGVGECLIQKQTMANDTTTTVTFSSVPQIFNRLKVVIIGQYVGATTSTVYMTLNNISTGTYDYEYTNSNNATAGTVNGLADTKFIVGILPGDGLTASKPGNMVIELPEYKDTNWYKSFVSNGGCAPASAANSYTITASGSNRATTAVTRIDFQTAGTNFKINTVFYLYGIM